MNSQLKLYIALLWSCLIALPVFSQKKNESYQIHIRQASSPIVTDGIMDETAWAEAEVATDFFMVLPMDTSFAKVRTEVRLCYDKQNLHLFITCFHARPGPYMVESLRRDFCIWEE